MAISWPQSQRVGDPEQFAAGDLDGLINVRYFSISNDPGAVVMDTLGLHVFGLPDVQCHFQDRARRDRRDALLHRRLRVPLR